MTRQMLFLVESNTIDGLALTESQKQPPEVFCKKGALKNFANFTGKQLC